MKPNVKMIDKSKNSFIYFQLGLIAVMVAVLFVLEFNFETTESNFALKKERIIDFEKPFKYSPAKEAKVVETVKKTVVKTITKPIVPLKVINQFIKTETEVNDDIVKDASHQDSNVSDANPVANPNDNPLDGNSGNGSEEEVFVVVEFLPRFPSCENVSKADQKACFDAQLKKEIFKHLKYPERDLENKKEGTVFVQFIVDQNGNFTSIKSAENNRATNDMRLAVENAVKKLPKIIPAKQGKKDVKVTYTIPISFKIGK
ncbi:energy transducer TonB [uncultured Flavobacterium sp.]|uniref:energy transducer TonB n=1 Tax=uncultured Flavobacterium sp. TaxID=165435 RepID=UPI0030EE3D48|tara:strand:- start:23218 stop:23994 length:777 start_codon:yes stop_codon:yes gene_type:complete